MQTLQTIQKYNKIFKTMLKFIKRFLNKCQVNFKKKSAIKIIKKNTLNFKIFQFKILIILIVWCTSISNILKINFQNFNFLKKLKIITVYLFFIFIMLFLQKNKCLLFRTIEFLNGKLLKKIIRLKMQSTS